MGDIGVVGASGAASGTGLVLDAVQFQMMLMKNEAMESGNRCKSPSNLLYKVLNSMRTDGTCRTIAIY